MIIAHYVALWGTAISMKRLALLGLLALASCATGYGPQGLAGGFSDYLTAPDEAVVMFHGNGYTSASRVVQMTALRCAEVTLAHGYRYFIVTGATDLSSRSSFTTPGYVNTNASVSAFGNFATGTATTTYTPPQTFNVYKPGLMVSIKLSNDPKSLEAMAMMINGQRTRPKDAAFLSQSLRQFLGIKNQG
jgi:hypothetical protein